MTFVSDLLHNLTPDEWRTERDFSPDIHEVHQRIFTEAHSLESVTRCIGEWFQKNQPCLFGRIAARQGMLSYCVLTESDLEESDEKIRSKIQFAREKWTAEAFEGKKSGFIIYCLSQRIALAQPDETLKALAQRICSLYLLKEIECDMICLDEVFLEKPGGSRRTWK